MNGKLAAALVAAIVAAAAAIVVARGGRDTGAGESAELIDAYCVDCHNAVDFAGSLRLDDKDAANVAADAEVWEHVVRKLRTGMMPPADAPRPDRAALDGLAAGLERRLDAAAAAEPVHAPPALRRLNRSEYANAIRDLLHLDVDVATLLPLDDSSEGFDNVATALGVSPSLVDAYVSAAMKLSRAAIGDRTAPRSQVSYAAPGRLVQDRHFDGLPLGTRGGLRIEHTFPLDAEYQIRVRSRFRLADARLDVTLDGVPIETDDPAFFRLPVTAGPHTLTAAIVDRRRPVGVDEIYAGFGAPAGVQSVEIDGPIAPSGVGDTPSRRRVLICTPASAADERPCAAEILSALAARAFRRPVSAEDIEPLLAFFDAASGDGFEAGIQNALARILVDPRFLYRLERDPAAAPAGAAYAVDDYALASRLSFFLWSSIPDDELLRAAAAGELGDDALLAAQARRMLADPKADALIDNFAAQWLFLRELDSVTPDADAFDENLRHAMTRETKLLFAAIVREDLSIVRLLDADFTFVDERLAEHYGFDGVRGSHFRRVEIPERNPRRGVLGHASILTLTSVTNRTSPVVRGAWILENLLGAPAPVPPPNVETTLEGDDGAATAATVRQRLEAHRANPTCAACHAIMDPVGFSLERFDLIGAWRETDAGAPIDARAVLVDGTVVEGPDGLRAALLGRSDAFATVAAEKLLTYALGRRLEYYDMPTIRAIVRESAGRDFRFSDLVLGVVLSEPFRTRLKEAGN